MVIYSTKCMMFCIVIMQFFLMYIPVHAYLTCQACEAGSFLLTFNGTSKCTLCPEHSTTGEFTNASQATDCFCEKGYTNITNRCIPCAIGFYKSTTGNYSCLSCEYDRSTIANGSTSIESCLCVEGKYQEVSGITTSTCKLCESGTYKDIISNSQCSQCDQNAYSIEGSEDVTACRCNAGFSGEPGSQCVACERGKYRGELDEQYICHNCPVNTYNVLDTSTSATNCKSCPVNTTTEGASGAHAPIQCTCDPGFEKRIQQTPEGSSWTCQECSAGSYQPETNSSSCVLCFPGQFSEAVASAQDQCIECEDGSYNTEYGASTCNECDAGTWQNLTVFDVKSIPCSVCPVNSTSFITASTTIKNCTCDPGFVLALNPYRCDACPAGSYCPESGLSFACASNTWSATGATSCTSCGPFSRGVLPTHMTSPRQCQCIPGYEGTGDSDCSACEVGKYQSEDYTYTGSTSRNHSIAVLCELCPLDTYQDNINSTACMYCPANSSAPSGSDAINDCICDARFYGFIDNTYDECTLCPVNTYCEGGQEYPHDCRTFSSSLIGQTSESDCVCDPRYYSEQAYTKCNVCPEDHFCPGGLQKTPCPGNSSSVRGAMSNDACLCMSAMWRGCIVNNNDTLVDKFGLPCEIDYTEPCYPCPPDTICYNETVLHCPTHSRSPRASSLTEDCVCTDGFFNNYNLQAHHDDEQAHHDDGDVTH